MIEDFEKYLVCFKEFLGGEGLGSLDLRRYEMTYIDHIPKGEGWETLSDIGNVFPSLFSSRNDAIFRHNIIGVDWKTGFVLPDEESQLQISIQSAQLVKDGHPVLRLDFTAHGRVDSEQHTSMRNWFDYIHDWMRRLFEDLISVEIQNKFWGRKSC